MAVRSCEAGTVETPDFLNDRVTLVDPYPYPDAIRARGPVQPLRPVDAVIRHGFC